MPFRRRNKTLLIDPSGYTGGGVSGGRVYTLPDVNPDEFKLRQRYAEGGFRDNLTSPAGAIGRYQVMPITYKEYTQRTGKTGDLLDPKFNEGLRDWYMDENLPKYEAVKRGNPSDIIREYRKYAAYNMGPGALNKALTKAVNAGIDIDNTTDWVSYLPKETRDYVNFIVGGRDIKDTAKTTALYDAARKKYGLYSVGGGIPKEEEFTKEYKEYYPWFKKYAGGGPKGIAPMLPVQLAKKYLTDYVNRGGVTGYPESLSDWIAYAISPYASTQFDWEKDKDYVKVRRALLAKYLGIEDGLDFNPDDYIEESPYKPSKASDSNAVYYRPKRPVGEVATSLFDAVVGNHVVDKGEDENGRYASFYDVWDLAPFSGKPGKNELGGNPVELYDRVYENEEPFTYYLYYPSDQLKSQKKKVQYKTLELKDGGNIHIKESKKGTFTAAANAHGKSVQAFASQVLANKDNYSPAMVKKANFARNAAKWHSDGGAINQAIDDGKIDILLAAINNVRNRKV